MWFRFLLSVCLWTPTVIAAEDILLEAIAEDVSGHTMKLLKPDAVLAEYLEGSSPLNVIDGDMRTEWNAGATRGTLSVSFMEAVALNRVRIRSREVYFSETPSPLRKVLRPTITTFKVRAYLGDQLVYESLRAPNRVVDLDAVRADRVEVEGVRIGGGAWLTVNELLLYGDDAPDAALTLMGMSRLRWD